MSKTKPLYYIDDEGCVRFLPWDLSAHERDSQTSGCEIVEHLNKSDYRIADLEAQLADEKEAELREGVAEWAIEAARLVRELTDADAAREEGKS